MEQVNLEILEPRKTSKICHAMKLDLQSAKSFPIISNTPIILLGQPWAKGQQRLRLRGANSPIAAAFSRGPAALLGVAGVVMELWNCGTVELVRSSSGV